MKGTRPERRDTLMSPNREPPFINLFDIAGILLVTIPMILLFVVGSDFPGRILWLVIGLFFTALFFARKGTPH